MKGILAALEQTESKLYPLAVRSARHLLPVYDKPLIYYPLAILMLAGIRDILILGQGAGLKQIRANLGNGAGWGLKLSYQAAPPGTGLAGAMHACERFWRDEPVALIGGETILHGKDLVDLLQGYAGLERGAGLFASSVRNPGSYPVIDLDPEDRPLRLEGPWHANAERYAVPNLYFFDRRAHQLLTESGAQSPERDGLSGLCRAYLAAGELRAVILGRGIAWLDVQTPEALLQASNFIQVIQERQGVMIACPEEIAYRMGFIRWEDLRALVDQCGQGNYRQHLARILEDENC